eukprot:UN10733
MSNPYNELTEPNRNNEIGNTHTQNVSVATMIWGESNPAHDNDHKNAGCCACSPFVSNIIYGCFIIGGALVALIAKFLSQYIHNHYRHFCSYGGNKIIESLCEENQTVYRICLFNLFLLYSMVSSNSIV